MSGKFKKFLIQILEPNYCENIGSLAKTFCNERKKQLNLILYIKTDSFDLNWSLSENSTINSNVVKNKRQAQQNHALILAFSHALFPD